MITFIQFLITGLRLGSVYALIALGYTMVYGIIKLINFAHGDFIMVGGYSLFFTIPVLMAAGIPGARHHHLRLRGHAGGAAGLPARP